MQPSLLSPDNQPTEGHFRPVPAVQALLLTLRNNDISWMANEIENSIQSGRLITRQYEENRGRKLKSGYTTIPFSEIEQLQIALETIRNYFVVLFQTWDEGQARLRESLENVDLVIAFAEMESSEQVTLFLMNYGEQIQSLNHLLDSMIHSILEQE